MSDHKTDSRQAIEARLERSLRSQVRAPRLDSGFDAAVWSRIDAEESNARRPVAAAAASRAVRAPRWLTMLNTLGVAVTLGIALYFALGSFGGIEPQPLSVDLRVPMPALPTDMVDQALMVLGQVLGLAALVFGLSFTSLGRRLRSSFS